MTEERYPSPEPVIHEYRKEESSYETGAQSGTPCERGRTAERRSRSLPEEQLQNAAGGKYEESVTDTDPAYTDPKTAHPSEPVR